MATYQCRTIVPIVPEQLRQLVYTRRANSHLPLALPRVKADEKVEEGGGVRHESDDIRLVEMPVADALELARDGEIDDAKTLIALQWFGIQRASLS